MREPRIHVDAALMPEATLALPDTAFRHVVQVLRLGVGARLSVFDGLGRELDATIETVTKREAIVRLGGARQPAAESPLHLTLAQALSKGDRMDYTLQKAVELGVAAIQPLITSRSVVRLDAEREGRKRDHWLGVIVSACEQCGRATLPSLAPLLPLHEWLALPPTPDALRLTLDPLAVSGLRDLHAAERVELLVGPEGGLTADELDAARQSGFTGIRLGPRVLRTETAGVAALAALQATWGDLG